MPMRLIFRLSGTYLRAVYAGSRGPPASGRIVPMEEPSTRRLTTVSEQWLRGPALEHKGAERDHAAGLVRTSPLARIYIPSRRQAEGEKKATFG